MNWIELHRSPLWKALWESPEMKSKVQQMHNLLVNANLEPEARGVVRGQIKFIESFPFFVEGLARQQAAREAVALADSEENAAAVNRFINEIPTIY